MNKVTLVLLLTFAAVACAPIPATPSATATVVPLLPTQTATQVPPTPAPPTPTALPTPTSTATPTITPTPSPTPRPKTGAADEWLGKGAEREALFNEYAQTIKDAQVFSELGFKRLGTTWEKELERTKKRFWEADTKLDVYYALLSLQRSLHDTHSALTVPAGLTPPSDTFSLPFTLAVRGNSLDNAQYVVVQSSSPEVKAGFILKQYGAKTIQQLEYDFSEWLDNTSPENLKIGLARALTRTNPSRYPSLDNDSPVTIAFIDPANQKETSVTIRWQRGAMDTPSKDYERLTLDYTGVNYRVYKDAATQTIVLVYSSFNYTMRDADLKNALARVSYPVPNFDRTAPLDGQSDWIAKFIQANQQPTLQGVRNSPFVVALEDLDTLGLAKYLDQQNEPNLLIDVRDNGGGSVPTNLLALIARERFRILTRELVYVPLLRRDSAFLQGTLTYTDNYMRRLISDQMAREKDAAKSPRFPFNCRTTSCALTEAEYEPNPNIKKFGVAILSGPGCISSCDQFVAIAKDNNTGAIVGLPSRGGHSPMRAPKEFALKNGDKFSMIFSAGIGYRPNGEPLEGNPAKVDYYLFPEDDYLSKTIQYLKARGSFK